MVDKKQINTYIHTYAHPHTTLHAFIPHTYMQEQHQKKKMTKYKTGNPYGWIKGTKDNFGNWDNGDFTERYEDIQEGKRTTVTVGTPLWRCQQGSQYKFKTVI